MLPSNTQHCTCNNFNTHSVGSYEINVVHPNLTLLTPLSKSLCIPISEVAGRQHPRSARRQQLNVPRVRRVIGRCAFASAGPTVWNSLPDNLCDSTVGRDQFQRELKTHLFACLLNISSIVHQRFFYVAALYKFIFTFTYLLTRTCLPKQRRLLPVHMSNFGRTRHPS